MWGAIWINTNLLELSTDADNFHNMVRQTIHAIAFHPALYDLWVDSSNSYAAWTTPVIETTARGKPVFKIATPAVIAAGIA